MSTFSNNLVGVLLGSFQLFLIYIYPSKRAAGGLSSGGAASASSGSSSMASPSSSAASASSATAPTLPVTPGGGGGISPSGGHGSHGSHASRRSSSIERRGGLLSSMAAEGVDEDETSIKKRKPVD